MNEIRDQLNAFRDGEVFRIDSWPTDDTTAILYVTERRYNENSLLYIKEVSSLCMYYKRRVVVNLMNERLTYIIF